MLTTKLTNIANAIRNKTQTSVAMTLDEMPSKIEGISTAENLTKELNTYNNELSEQETTIEDIMEALKDKGIGQVPKYAPRYSYMISFRSYKGTELDYEIKNIDTSNVTSMNSMFYSCQNLTNLDLSNFNTDKVTDMKYMFYSCQNLTNLDLSSFNTNKVTDMSYMFQFCRNLTNLDIRNFDTSNVTNTGTMFESCSGLTNLDVSNFNTSKVTNMSYMFCTCSGLTNLDLSNFDTSKVTNMSAMFRYCRNLTSLDIRNFDFAKVTNYSGMFDSFSADCLIIVKDETAKEWITSKFTDLTNVKTVAELEEV